MRLDEWENVAEQWRRFQVRERVDESGVRPVILRSWKRCLQMNVNPDGVAKVNIDPGLLGMRLEKNTELVSVAKSIMEKLFNPISTSNSLISLADAEGVVLYALWDKTRSYPVPHIAPGNLAAENVSGTNAIGTCLVERSPVETLGAEHYCRAFHGWFCSAAPIWGLRNQIVGVLNVTLPRDSYHHHTRGMMEAAAFAISEQMHLRRLLDEHRATIEMLDEGVVVMDDDGVIKSMNRKARTMLGVSPDTPVTMIQEIIFSHDILRILLTEKSRFTDQEAQLKLRKGSIGCMLSLSRLENEKGQVLTLRESGRVKEAAVRVTGAKAVYTFENIIGNDPITEKTIRMARLAAQSDVTTLILGESGTGKELFAQSIHNGGKRASGPFVVVNCGALPRNLVQSELFGYDEGSFTGASRLGKPGKFELADNGTIFLDEIGEMPLDAQVSLLRLLQNGEVTRVGGKQARHVNVRVIAATNRNLEEAIRQNAFREDLFYRLNVFSLRVPPLRERSGDIQMLVRYFLYNFAHSLGRPSMEISGAAMSLFMAYPWPGNIRELENTMERIVHMSEGASVIDTDILPENILRYAAGRDGTSESASCSGGILLEQERETLIQTLVRHGGNIRAAARDLGISRSGLYVKLKRFGISPDACR